MFRTLLASTCLLLALASLAHADPATNPLLKGEFFTDKTTIEQVQAEIAKGASVTETDEMQANALYHALSGHAPVEVIKFISDAGAKLDMPEGSRADPMVLAAVSYGDIGLLEYFKAKGVDFTVVNDIEEGGLHSLCYVKHFDPKVLEFLLAEGGPANDPSHLNAYNETLAMNVVWSKADNWKELLDAFIALGADPTGIRTDGMDAFMAAVAYSDNLEVAKHFLQYSEDPLARDKDGKDGILLGATGMTQEKLDYLVSLDFQTASLDAKGNSALMLAAEHGEADVVKLWLAQGLDATDTNKAGETALKLAAGENGTEVLQILLDAGADVNAADDKGVTPLFAALGRQANGHDDAEAAIETAKKTQGVIDLLIAKGGDLTVIDSRGRTALIVAVEADQPVALIRQILATGVDVNAKDAEGTSALMAAVMGASDPEVLTVLLDAGADTSLRDVFDDSLAMMATENAALAGAQVLSRLK